jgi:hypothetical protein
MNTKEPHSASAPVHRLVGRCNWYWNTMNPFNSGKTQCGINKLQHQLRASHFKEFKKTYIFCFNCGAKINHILNEQGCKDENSNVN